MHLLLGLLLFGAVFVWVLIASLISGIKERRLERERKERIHAKHPDSEIAERLNERRAWVGQTAEQLIDSLGAPLDVDQKVLKTKKKEIWKYVRKGRNRYGLRFTLENDILVGWDEKL